MDRAGWLVLAAVLGTVAVVALRRGRLPTMQEIERAVPMEGLTPAALTELRDAARAISRHKLAKRFCNHVLVGELDDATCQWPPSADDLRDLEAWSVETIAEPRLRQFYPGLVARLTAALSMTTRKRFSDLQAEATEEAIHRLFASETEEDIEANGFIDEPLGGEA